jgi:hypothetical protein
MGDDVVAVVLAMEVKTIDQRFGIGWSGHIVDHKGYSTYVQYKTN